jgi:DNA adenine methylase
MSYSVTKIKPFVKWVGGKRSVLPHLLQRVPKSYISYHEPFLGGGALYFALQPSIAYLSDINPKLVLTYLVVKNDIDELVRQLYVHKTNHNKDYYLRMRAEFANETDATKIASKLIYLNKTGFNGLYRVNKSGGYNVPMGKYKNPSILEESNLRAISTLLQNTNITTDSFINITPISQQFYYIDPPYHRTFSDYDASDFKEEQHRLLALKCSEIDNKGAYFMLSNSDTPFVRNLYKNFNIEQISAKRTVSCKASTRGQEHELLIRNYQ